VVFLVALLGVGVPMMLAHGIVGFGMGLAASTLATLVLRLRYLARLFPGARLVRHIAHGVVPTLPGAAAVLAGRAIFGADDSVGRMLAECAVYIGLVAAATWAIDGALLREAVRYALRRGRPEAALVS